MFFFTPGKNGVFFPWARGGGPFFFNGSFFEKKKDFFWNLSKGNFVYFTKNFFFSIYEKVLLAFKIKPVFFPVLKNKNLNPPKPGGGNPLIYFLITEEFLNKGNFSILKGGFGEGGGGFF